MSMLASTASSAPMKQRRAFSSNNAAPASRASSRAHSSSSSPSPPPPPGHHDSIAVVLVEPQGPVNVGAVARLCQNFGFRDLRIVDARQSVFADAGHLRAQAEEARSLGDDARAAELMDAAATAWTRSGGGDEYDDERSASEARVATEVGFIHGETYKYSTDASAALLHGAFRVGGVDAAIDDCTFVVALTARSRGGTPVLSVREAAEAAAAAVLAGGKVALLFGNERTGLENHHMRAVHATALISTGREKSSLNLSHAVGISLHEQHAALVGLDGTFHSRYFANETQFN